jgi:hypothetical protein
MENVVALYICVYYKVYVKYLTHLSTSLGYGLDSRGSRVRFMGGGGLRIFLLTTTFRPALGSTNPPIEWI